MLKLRHIALSAFEIINDSSTILIDPFVSLNAQYNYRNSKNISDISLPMVIMIMSDKRLK